MGEQKKSRLQRICNIATYVVLAGIILCALILLGVSLIAVMMLVDPSLTLDGMDRNELFFLIIASAINQVISIALFYYLMKLTKSIGHESSPFTSANVRLLKLMAVILLIGWVFAMAVEVIITALWELESTGLNVDALVMAGIIYVISLVFEYGVRLQEESDGFV